MVMGQNTIIFIRTESKQEMFGPKFLELNDGFAKLGTGKKTNMLSKIVHFFMGVVRGGEKAPLQNSLPL